VWETNNLRCIIRAHLRASAAGCIFGSLCSNRDSNAYGPPNASE
jgi:hypothetical protein